MNARQAQLAMYRIELHGQEFSVEQFMHWLLKLDDEVQDLEPVLLEEMARVMSLLSAHYGNYIKLTPQAAAAVGFQQGATFAAAALGREPYSRS